MLENKKNYLKKCLVSLLGWKLFRPPSYKRKFSKSGHERKFLLYALDGDSFKYKYFGTTVFIGNLNNSSIMNF